MKSIVTLFMATYLVLVACQKEIKIDLNDSIPKTVTTANLIANDSIVVVHVSKTSSYFDGYADNYINDAVVTISENNGAETIIPFIENGLYKLTGYSSTVGANYTIKVVHDGAEYTSSQVMNAPIPLLPLTSEFREGSFMGPEGYAVTFSFQDPPQTGNAYRVIYTYDGERRDKFSEINIFNDDFTNGNVMEGQPFDVFEIGDTVIVELQTINRSMYNYYYQLQINTSSFTAANGNPNYVWSNQALGYFSAHSYDTDTIIIQP